MQTMRSAVLFPRTASSRNGSSAPARFLLCVLAVLAVLPAATTWSGEPEPLRPMVVTARAWPEHAEHLPASVATWRPDTDGWGFAGGLPDLAEETPGVNRTADGPWASDLSIRGLSGDRIVVTLDGARLVTATDLAARLALIDLSVIERVEVFKGPVSALYGSGSLGGMVNVVLSEPIYPDESDAQQRLRLGVLHNPDGWTAHYGATHRAPRQYINAAITARDAAAFRDGNGDRIRNTQFSDQALSLRVGRRWAPHADSDVLVQIHRGEDIGIPGSGSAPLSARADVTYEEARRILVAFHNRLWIDGAHWKTSRLNLYYQQIERTVRIDAFPEGPLREIKPVGRHDTLGARWLNQIEAGDHQIGAGLETWRRELESTRKRTFVDGAVLTDRPLPEASEWSYGAFVEDRWILHPALSLTAGARGDGLRVENRVTPQWEAESKDDWNWNAHAGLRWNATERWALRGVTAAGYRAPSIEERYQFLALGDGQIKLGNPDLDAEQSRFVEIGMAWNEDHWSAEISGFHNALRNRIGEERVDEQTLRNANTDRARIQGVEAETRRRLSDAWSAHASLAWLRGDDRGNREPLPDIAPLTGSAGLRYRPAPAWLARARVVFAARQGRVPEGAEETPGWGRMDASLAYTTERGAVAHEIRLDVLNVTDTAWRNHLNTHRGKPDYEPGRSLQIVWDAQF